MKLICMDDLMLVGDNDKELKKYGVYEVKGTKVILGRPYYRFTDDENDRHYCEDRFLKYGEIYTKKQALEFIMKGIRVKHIDWHKSEYIYLNEEQEKIFTENDIEYILDLQNLKEEKWEVYGEIQKENLPKEFDWVKDIPWDYEEEKINCDILNCSTCPLKYVECAEVSISIAKLREKYEF